MKTIVLILVVLVTGCAPMYKYNSTKEADPVIHFGELFNEKSMFDPPFFIAYWDKGEVPECGQLIRIGTNTKTVRVPEGKMVGVTGFKYLGGSDSCSPPGRMFLAEPGGSYSIDLEMTQVERRVVRCMLKVMNKNSSKELWLDEAPTLVCKPSTKN